MWSCVTQRTVLWSDVSQEIARCSNVSQETVLWSVFQGTTLCSVIPKGQLLSLMCTSSVFQEADAYDILTQETASQPGSTSLVVC